MDAQPTTQNDGYGRATTEERVSPNVRAIEGLAHPRRAVTRVIFRA